MSQEPAVSPQKFVLPPLCWVYFCPNEPTTTATIRRCTGRKHTTKVRVCEDHKRIKAGCT